MADPVSATLGLASTGLAIGGSLSKSNAQAQGAEFQAQQAEVASQYGQIKASQTSTYMSQDLQTSLQNIQAVRASAGVEGNSPTGLAILNNTNAKGQQQIQQKVGNIEEQSQSDKDAAAFYTQSAGNALEGGDFAAAGQLAGGLGGAFKSSGFGKG